MYLSTDLPTLKVYNMLGDYGESNKDLYPAKYGGKPQHERSVIFPDLQKSSRQGYAHFSDCVSPQI